MKQIRRKIAWIGMLTFVVFLFGCKSDKLDEHKVKNLEYTVTSEDRLPEELKDIVDGKKEQPFKMTFRDGEYLYICQGYGEQPCGGYSIQVEEVYQTTNAVYFSSALIGPSQAEERIQMPTYPYIVIKTEYQDMTVVFD
nr:protease complex subunit PrcB family protein [Lachnospiraceae bacterium]